MNYTIVSLPGQTPTQGGGSSGSKSYKILSLPGQASPNALPGGRAGQNPVTQPKPQGGFFGAISQGANQIGAGIDKSILGTATGMAQIGKGIANEAAKVPGLGFLGTPDTSASAKSLETASQASKPTNALQSVGKIGGDIAQFFIPGGAEKAAAGKVGELVDSLDMAKLAETLGPKAPDIIKGILKVVGSGAVSASSMAGVTAAQTGGNAEAVKTSAEIGGAFGAAGKALEVFGKPIADSLQKMALKIPPQKAADLGSKADSAASWIVDNVGYGTPNSQYTKTANLVNGYEKTLQDFLSTTAKDVTVPKDDIVSKLEGLKSQFNDERDSLAIDKQIDGMISTIKAKQPDDIPLKSLNTLKRSTYTSAYNKAGSKVVDWVEAYIGNTFKGAIEDATKGMEMDGQDIAAFNKEYGNGITAKSLLKIAKGKQVGLSGKALLLLMGSGAGLPGEAAGLLLGGKSGITGLAETGLGSLLQGGATTIPAAAKVGLGVFNPGPSQATPQP